MFDHGIDAMNVTLEVILAQAAFGYSRSWWTVASQAAAISNFYLSTWEEYHTGTLYLSAFSGPVEGILMICVMYAITALKGPAVWATPIIKLVPYTCNLIDSRLARFGVQQKMIGAVPALSFSQLGNKAYTALASVGWLSDLSIREAFMWFGAVGLLGNIANSYVSFALPLLYLGLTHPKLRKRHRRTTQAKPPPPPSSFGPHPVPRSRRAPSRLARRSRRGNRQQQADATVHLVLGRMVRSSFLNV
jgi:hypothetical protein